MADPPRLSPVRLVLAAAIASGGVGLAYVLLESFRTRAEWVDQVGWSLTAALIAPMAIFVGVAMFFRAIPPRRRSAPPAARPDEPRDPDREATDHRQGRPKS